MQICNWLISLCILKKEIQPRPFTAAVCIFAYKLLNERPNGEWSILALLEEGGIAFLVEAIEDGYPQFPDTIAFDNNCKREGIACHHPKLSGLQRKYSIQFVIMSNLVEKQRSSCIQILSEVRSANPFVGIIQVLLDSVVT
ncbi:hypothetical protein VNO77_39945 [Canavalia gladiata]|uniref:Uncharacterized protein n=1 Tax=Canavalia gladiata TaxID=3824 RepID=A0AAN9JZ86_CANGL